MIAVNFEGATIQIDFEPIDVFVTDAGWITGWIQPVVATPG